MQLIQMPRGFGKSTTIVNLMAVDDDSICIVVNHQMAEYMARILAGVLADRSGAAHVRGRDVSKLTETRFFTPDQWVTTGRMKKQRKVYVDDLDMVLNQLLGVGVEVATYSPSKNGY